MYVFSNTGIDEHLCFVPIVSIIGDGDADLAKHLFMVPLSLDFTFIMFISDILNHQLWLTEQEEDGDA
nr:hypothetical protein [Pediococcus pentosaceus]